MVVESRHSDVDAGSLTQGEKMLSENTGSIVRIGNLARILVLVAFSILIPKLSTSILSHAEEAKLAGHEKEGPTRSTPEA